jgi:DNA-binding response OmpR family regulator
MGVLSPVLVVEDDAVVRAAVLDLLQDAGYASSAVSSCAEARRAADTAEFACALIDLGLPDGNGLALLPDLKKGHPWLVPVILTGDQRPETIVETMRAGAFDYVIKPFGAAALKSAVVRAIEHHDAIRERDQLFEMLAEERERLKVRVEEATADLRQYAAQIETVNARLQSLLRLTQVSRDFYTDEMLFRGVFEELDKYMPIHCVALCSSSSDDFLAAVRGESGDVRVIISDGGPGTAAAEAVSQSKEADPVSAWVERHTGLDTSHCGAFPYPQTFWGRTLCTVAFFVSPEFEVDAACDEFLGMCAHFIATEWQEAQLFLHATKEASLGHIALELSNGFVQGLTAIRTAADVAEEMRGAPEASEALRIICDNVESIQRQIQEFRQLSAPRKDTVETVYLNEYVDQALEMLASAIQGRGIRIDKEYQVKSECVLLNGSALARTFLDLISSAVRTVQAGGRILLRLTDTDPDTIVFEIGCEGVGVDLFGAATGLAASSSPQAAMRHHPKFLLAQRTVRSCGGKLGLEHRKEGGCAFRIQLPKHAVSPGQIPEATT